MISEEKMNNVDEDNGNDHYNRKRSGQTWCLYQICRSVCALCIHFSAVCCCQCSDQSVISVRFNLVWGILSWGGSVPLKAEQPDGDDADDGVHVGRVVGDTQVSSRQCHRATKVQGPKRAGWRKTTGLSSQVGFSRTSVILLESSHLDNLHR